MRSKQASRILGLACALAACRAEAPPPPPIVRIDLVNCGIGFGKADGTQWDGSGRVPANLIALAGKGDLGWKEFALTAYNNAIEKPDPIGEAELDRGDGFAERKKLAADGDEQEDTLLPTWSPIPPPPLSQ